MDLITPECPPVLLLGLCPPQFDIPRMQELRRSCCLMANSLDGMLYFFFHQTLFRISLSGVMTPVADLVQAAVNLLRENLVSPPVVSNASLPATASASPPVAVGDNSDCRRTARSTRREKRERRGGRRTHSSAEGRSRVRSKGKLTGATNENGDSSFSYGLQPTTGVGATADDDASSSPLRVSPRERRGDEEEETFWSDIRHFHTKLGGADPSVPLEVVSCCIDGRGWCFFTVQEKDPKVRRKVSGQRSGGVPANDAGDSNSSGGTSNTSDFSPEGKLSDPGEPHCPCFLVFGILQVKVYASVESPRSTESRECTWLVTNAFHVHSVQANLPDSLCSQCVFHRYNCLADSRVSYWVGCCGLYAVFLSFFSAQHGVSGKAV